MREILFRGKTKDGGEWVEGFFAAKENKSYIVTVDTIDPVKNHEAFICVEVIPETVGQFTGMTDKNGKKIFEGESGYPISLDCEVISNVYDNPKFWRCKNAL